MSILARLRRTLPPIARELRDLVKEKAEELFDVAALRLKTAEREVVGRLFRGADVRESVDEVDSLGPEKAQAVRAAFDQMLEEATPRAVTEPSKDEPPVGSIEWRTRHKGTDYGKAFENEQAHRKAEAIMRTLGRTMTKIRLDQDCPLHAHPLRAEGSRRQRHPRGQGARHGQGDALPVPRQALTRGIAPAMSEELGKRLNESGAVGALQALEVAHAYADELEAKIARTDAALVTADRARSALRQTRTFALLEVERSLYDVVREKLVAADYGHAFSECDGREVIDMHGLALVAEQETKVVPSPNGMLALATDDEVVDRVRRLLRERIEGISQRAELNASVAELSAPVDMILHCPNCDLRHVDAPDPVNADDPEGPRWTNPPHRTHLCAGCGQLWRPSDRATNGVEKLASGPYVRSDAQPPAVSDLVIDQDYP